MKPTASYQSEPRPRQSPMLMRQPTMLATGEAAPEQDTGPGEKQEGENPATVVAAAVAPKRMRPDLSAEQEALIDDLEGYIPRLRRYARSLSGDHAKADDLTQDTLLRALDKLHQFQPGTNLLAWLFTIMRNTYLNGIRAAKFTKDADPHEMQIPAPGNQIDSLALQELSVAIDTLPDDQRETLMLIGVEGLAYQEVAEIMDVPIGTVRSRLSRARAALRPLLEGPSIVEKAETS